jgi:ATP-binding cassette, subfamily B, bacterial IrtB/YbtQ
MLKAFTRLLGADAPVFWRYASMAVSYGLLSGLTVTALVPVLRTLLAGDLHAATWWLAALVAGVVACWAWRRQVEKASVDVRIAVLQGARQRLGDHIARLPVGWFTPRNTSRLNHILTHGMFELSELPAHLLTPIITGVVTPLVFVATLFVLHWPLGLITLAALPVLAGVFMISAMLGQRADEAFHHNAAQASQRMVEFAQAQSVLRAFNGGGNSTRFLEQAIDQQRDTGTRLITASTASVVLNTWGIQATFAVLLASAALWLSSHLGASLPVDAITTVIASLLLIHRFVDPLLDVAGYGEALRNARGQLDSVNEILSVRQLPETETPQVPRDSTVELNDVHFRYAPDQPDVLRGLSLRIEPGSMTALVGASGSGKSTLVRLIARFFDVNRGAVQVGGIDVRQMSGAQLANQISQIFQDTYLFQGSIADNIRIGKPNASDEEILEAARDAGALEIIKRLPQGMDTPVGEGGTRLSGGERQRISIARALIKDAPILLVDEATAALDAENQAAVTDTLARLRGKHTLVVIAHQLSTVSMADRIVVLEDGVVREQGTHEQLRAQHGLYAHFLAQRQAAKGWRIG